MTPKIGAVLKSLLRVAGKNDVRYYLNAVHIYRDDTGLVLESSDGHRLMRVTCTDPDIIAGFPAGTNITLDRKDLDRAVKLGDDLPFIVGDDGVTYGGVSIATVQCNYPDVTRVMSMARQGAPDVEKGVNIELLLSTGTAIRDLLKAHKSKFISCHVVQTPADRSFVWYGKTAGDSLTYEAHLMPCRI